MSHKAYTASERRGVFAIAVLALLLVGAGLIFSHCEGMKSASATSVDNAAEIEVSAVPDSLLDTEATTKKNKKKQKNSGSKTKKEKSTKSYRQRSPLDEPV